VHEEQQQPQLSRSNRVTATAFIDDQIARSVRPSSYGYLRLLRLEVDKRLVDEKVTFRTLQACLQAINHELARIVGTV